MKAEAVYDTTYPVSMITQNAITSTSNTKWFRFLDQDLAGTCVFDQTPKTELECADLSEADPSAVAFRYTHSTQQCCGKSGPMTDAATESSHDYYDPNYRHKFYLNRNQPFKEYACLWAENTPGNKFSKKINFEVCGTENVSLVGASQETYSLDFKGSDFVSGGFNYVTTDVTSLRSRFQTNSAETNCVIT